MTFYIIIKEIFQAYFGSIYYGDPHASMIFTNTYTAIEKKASAYFQNVQTSKFVCASVDNDLQILRWWFYHLTKIKRDTKTAKKMFQNKLSTEAQMIILWTT